MSRPPADYTDRLDPLVRSIAARMTARGMTQTDLAGASGMTPQRVNDIMTGRKQPTSGTAARLMTALGMLADPKDGRPGIRRA